MEQSKTEQGKKKKKKRNSAKVFHVSPERPRQQLNRGSFTCSGCKHWMMTLSLYQKFSQLTELSLQY